MVEVNNPYLKQIRELMVSLDNEENQEKRELLLALQEKSRAWTQDKLAEILDGKFVQSEKIVEIKDDKEKYPSLNKQYKEACNTYKNIMEIVDEIRALKKSLRDEIALQRERNKNEN